jgi:hypothetical protein
MMVTTINVGLSSWIIEDGNYSDFASGQETKFALEFYGPELRRSERSDPPSLSVPDEAEYSAHGHVEYVSEGVWVCNFGVLAYREETPPEWAREGVHAEGNIYLGVDPFFYFEGLHKLPGMPKLTYQVRIRRIWLDTTPWIPDPNGTFTAVRDISRKSRVEVHDTSHGTGEGSDEFILECDILQSGVDPVGR